MNKFDENLLICMAEECSEVIQIISKTLRFGLDSKYEGKTNLEKLEMELRDVMTIFTMLCENEIVKLEKIMNNNEMDKKRDKINYYFEKYSKNS